MFDQTQAMCQYNIPTSHGVFLILHLALQLRHRWILVCAILESSISLVNFVLTNTRHQPSSTDTVVPDSTHHRTGPRPEHAHMESHEGDLGSPKIRTIRARLSPTLRNRKGSRRPRHLKEQSRTRHTLRVPEAVPLCQRHDDCRLGRHRRGPESQQRNSRDGEQRRRPKS